MRRDTTRFPVSRGRSGNWFCEHVWRSEEVPLISYFRDGIYLRFNGLTYTQNNKFRSEDKPTILNPVQLNDIIYVKWCFLMMLEIARLI
jgi:hypothetical protein